MEKGEVTGLGHLEARAGFSSLGAADSLPARPLGLPAQAGALLDVVCLLYLLGRGSTRAVRHCKMYQDCELCLHR